MSPLHAVETAAEAKLIDEGFKLFTKETFDGNGRTCGTCHIPKESYNIFPSNIKKLKSKDRKLVFATNVPGLENPDLVKSHALFNISGRADTCLASDPECFDPAVSIEGHSGPVFRSTMGIFGLEVTTNNESGGFPGTPLYPAFCSEGFENQLPQLGWSGDGSPGTPADNSGECSSHHGSLPHASVDGSVRAFAWGAVAQHASKSLERIEGFDFRFPEEYELDALEAHQLWLGRRALTPEENAIQGTTDASEFDVTLLDFKDPRVALGRDHFVGPPEFATFPGAPPTNNADAGAGCNGCHRNGGAKLAGNNININTDVELGSDDIGMKVVGVALPHDEGASTSFGNPTRDPDFQEAFNIQSIIEAAQKKAWFHNHRVSNKFEKAIEFYISSDFTDNAGAFTSEHVMRNGNTSGSISFPKGDGVEHIGAFLRALNAFYNLRDCERLIDEAIDRVAWKVSLTLPLEHCAFNLDHTAGVLKGAKLPKLHKIVQKGAKNLKKEMKRAKRSKRVDKLLRARAIIHAMRNSIATQTVPLVAVAP
jgi:hypothetical protein